MRRTQPAEGDLAQSARVAPIRAYGEPGPDAPAVAIRRADRTAVVFGKPKSRLSGSETDVIGASEGWPRGLTLGEMAKTMGNTSGLAAINRLKASDPDWDVAMIKPGIQHGRYKIAFRSISPDV